MNTEPFQDPAIQELEASIHRTNLVICFENNGGIRSKWPNFAENVGYGTSAKIRPLATEIGLKKGPLWAAYP